MMVQATKEELTEKLYADIAEIVANVNNNEQTKAISMSTSLIEFSFSNKNESDYELLLALVDYISPQIVDESKRNIFISSFVDYVDSIIDSINTGHTLVLSNSLQ